MSVIGLVFNFDIGVNKTGDRIGISVDIPEVEAQTDDTATTTVTVQNAPPTFTGVAAESPASASTSPVNVGSDVTFIGTGDDAESNDYYLLVCDIDGATPGAGGSAPSCTGGGAKQFCVSAVASSTVQASCSYTVEASIVAETQAWVAYVCDNHSDEAACSVSSNSGTGDPGTPFHINHAPLFSEVTTTVDNQVPGDDFTFLASTTDSDIVGGVDVLSIYVCSTDSWTVAGCDATTLCTATSTSPDASCSWTSTVPLDDVSYNYWAFVKDEGDLPSTGNSQTSNYTIANATPSVSSVLLNDGNPITLNLKGASNIAVYASSTSVTDDNGCGDISSATGTIYWSDATGGADCSQDDNDCYPIPVACTVTGCTGGVDVDVDVQCSADLAYFALPTSGTGLDANPNWDTDWLASIRAFDEAASYASSSSGVDLNATLGIEVNEAEIAYGSLVANTDSGTDNATTTIVNAGNTPLDTQLIGEDMLRDGIGPESIPALNQQFDLANFDYGVGSTPIASSSQILVDTAVPRPTSVTDVEDDIYWGIAVPIILSGDYTGLNTFTAVLDDNVAGEW